MAGTAPVDETGTRCALSWKKKLTTSERRLGGEQVVNMEENSDQQVNFPPPKISWFEFLLDEGLLERHLSQSNPGKIIKSRYYFIIAHRLLAMP